MASYRRPLLRHSLGRSKVPLHAPTFARLLFVQVVIMAELGYRPTQPDHLPADIEVPDPASDQRTMVPVPFIALTAQVPGPVGGQLGRRWLEPTRVRLAVPEAILGALEGVHNQQPEAGLR
jgi:hypothetical protein